MTRQYVQLAYSTGGPLYTFVNDEDHDIRPGDEVEFEGRNGQMLTRTVEAIQEDAPSFQCKPCFKV